MRELTKAELAGLVPWPAREANKYSRGVCLVVAGSEEYPGAAVLAARASARAGAGYTRLCTPAAPVARAHLLSIPVTQATTAAQVRPYMSQANALVIGPGIGTSPAAEQLLAGILEEAADRRIPALLDADALNLLAAKPNIQALAKRCTLVLTPHAGEAARFSVENLEDEFGATVVYKGPDTRIAQAGEETLIMTVGGPVLARAGTGDVLAGIIGGLLAQGLAPRDAAALGTYLHASAGNIAAKQHSVVATLPEDIIECIGAAVLQLKG